MSLEDDVSAKLAQIGSEIRAVGQEANDAGQKGQTFSAFLGGMVGGAVIGAVQQLGNEFRQLATEITALGMQGAALRATFENLGGGAGALEQLRAATSGMVDDMTLMQAANKFLLMGLAQTTDEAAKLAQMASTLGMAMGVDAATAMADFAAMLANQSIPRLDNFGISSGRVRQMMEELMATTAGMTREQAFLQAVMTQGEQAMARLGDQTQTAAAGFAGIRAALQNMKMELGEAVLPLLEAMLPAIEQIVDVFAEWLGNEQFRENIVNIANGLALILGKIQEFAQSEGPMRQFVNTLGEIYGKIIGLATGITPLVQGIQGMASLFGLMAQKEAEAAQKSQDLAVIGEMARASGEEMEQLKAKMREPIEMPIPDDSWKQYAERTYADIDEFLIRFEEGLSKLGPLYSEAMSAIEDSAARHGEMMTKIAEQGAMQAADAELRYQMESLQRALNYEAEAQRLREAGKEAEIANLTAKFQAMEANSAASYEQQKALQARALVIQQIQQQKAYIEELKAQQRQTVLKITQMLIEQKAQGNISAETQRALLSILTAGQSEQLKAQVQHALAMSEVSNKLNMGMVRDAKTAVEGIMAAYQQNIEGAEAALSALQANLEDRSAEILATIRAEYTPEDFGFDPKLGQDLERTAKETTEPATRALSQVVKEIDEGIKAAMSAIKNLVDFELPAGVDEGLDKVGEFAKMAVTKVYEWLDAPVVAEAEEKIKDRLKKIKDSLQPLAQTLQLIGVDLTRLKIVEELPDLRVWAEQMGQVFEAAFGLAKDIRERYGVAAEGEEESELQKVASVISSITSILSIANADASRMNDLIKMPWPDLAKWGARLYAIIERATEVLAEIKEKVTNLEIAADIADNVKKVLSVVGASLSFKVPEMDDYWGSLKIYLSMLAEVARQTRDELMNLDEEWRKADMIAPEVAENVKKVLDVLGVDLPEPAVPALFRERLSEWLDTVVATAKEVRRKLDEMGEEWIVSEIVATTVVKHIKDVLAILGIKLDFVLPESMRGLGRYLDLVMETAEVAKEKLDTLPEVWKQAELSASQVAKNVKDVLSILSAGLEFKLPNIRHYEAKLDQYFGYLRMAAERAIVRIGELGKEWELAELPAATAANNIKKVLDLLNVNLIFEPPPRKYDLSANVDRFLSSIGLILPRVMDFVERMRQQYAEIRNEIEVDLLAEAADTVQSILDVLSIFDIGQQMNQLAREGLLGNMERIVTGLMTQIERALSAAIPRLKDLQELYADDIEAVAGFIPVVSEQIDILLAWAENMVKLSGRYPNPTTVLGVVQGLVNAFNWSVAALAGINVPEGFAVAYDLMQKAATAPVAGGIGAAGGEGAAAMARFYDAVGRFEGAVTHFGEAVNIIGVAAPQMAIAATQLAAAAVSLGAGGAAQAIEDYTSRGA